jgi:hypothetical protein
LPPILDGRSHQGTPKAQSYFANAFARVFKIVLKLKRGFAAANRAQARAAAGLVRSLISAVSFVLRSRVKDIEYR